MTLKKYTISLNGLLSHENIIFKLICSVSERAKNRESIYLLSQNNQHADIYINDIKNKLDGDVELKNRINVWVTDQKNELTNTISRPLIATRVLHTLDSLVKDTVPVAQNEVIESQSDSLEFSISEEEASELAIVHDEILENPANKEETPSSTNIELTLVKNEIIKPIIKKGFRHVLVVDDSPSVRKQLELELELFDVVVDFADCAASAFEKLKTNTYDLALLDVVLPDKDGFFICKYVKSTSKETIVIMLTGKATQADKIKGSLAGCNEYLIKPVGRITFQNAVKNHISLKNTHTAIEA